MERRYQPPKQEEKEMIMELSETSIEKGVEDIEKLRATIAKEVKEELSKNAVKLWVKHELEEVVGGIILEHAEVMVNKIVYSVNEKLKAKDINLEETRAQALEKTARKVIEDTEAFFNKKDFKEALLKKCQNIVRDEVHSRAKGVMNETISELKPQLATQFRKQVTEIGKEETGKLAIQEISTILAQVQDLRERFEKLQDRVNELGLEEKRRW